MKLCNLETSKALQELGYDGEYTYCHVSVYPKNEYQIMTISECEKYRHDIGILCAAPRLDDVAYWLRKKYGIHISVIPDLEAQRSDSYGYHIWRYHPDTKFWHGDTYCVDYPHDYALESAVTKAIEIIKNKKQ